MTAVASPYRNVESYPPISLSNVDEVDLQAQWEQVALPYHAAHSVDYYKRPGKPAWFHPEVWNDAGTGDQIVPTLFQALMRGRRRRRSVGRRFRAGRNIPAASRRTRVWRTRA